MGEVVNPIAFGLISSFIQIHWCRISGAVIDLEDRTGVRVLGGAASSQYRSFRNFFCPTPPTPPAGQPPLPPFPFEGGQCNIQYRVFTDYEGEFSGGFDAGTLGPETVWGPIEAIAIKDAQTFWQWIITAKRSQFGPTEPLTFAGGTFTAQGQYISELRSYVVPVSGQDTCGNPPPVLPPEGDEFYTDDFTVTVNNEGDSYSFPITITSNPTAPTIDDSGGLTVPITINFPDNGQSITVDIDIDGDISVTGGNPPFSDNPNRPPNGGGGGGGSSGPNADPDGYETDGDPPPAPPGTETPPEEPTVATAIRGAIVTCTNATQVNGVTEIFQSSGLPTVYAPYLGLLNFYIKTAEGDGGWTADIPIKNARQFVPCDWVGGAADVRVSPRSNAILQVTPVLYKIDE